MDDIANIWTKLNVNARNSFITLNKAERQKEKRKAGEDRRDKNEYHTNVINL